VQAAIVREVERFLFREARLLDERRFHEWLSLFTDDVRYWMPGHTSRHPRTSKAITVLAPAGDAAEPMEEDGLAIFDETRETLGRRVARLDTGMAWAEDPPSRTRHLVSNIEVAPGDTAGELRAWSNFIVYRTGADSRPDMYVGARQDVLRRVGAEWNVCHRKIVLDQNVLLAKHVSVFF
jgi:3-phenylpropionate/cinnamic acid dioxygenase small subunit